MGNNERWGNSHSSNLQTVTDFLVSSITFSSYTFETTNYFYLQSIRTWVVFSSSFANVILITFHNTFTAIITALLNYSRILFNSEVFI